MLSHCFQRTFCRTGTTWERRARNDRGSEFNPDVEVATTSPVHTVRIPFCWTRVEIGFLCQPMKSWTWMSRLLWWWPRRNQLTWELRRWNDWPRFLLSGLDNSRFCDIVTVEMSSELQTNYKDVAKRYELSERVIWSKILIGNVLSLSSVN